MMRVNRRTRRIAAALSAIAGYVDAVGFLSLGGFFVSFMSGNSTRLAVALATFSSQALTALALIASFVLGVVVGALVAKRSRRPQAAVITLVATLLVIAAASGTLGFIVLSVFVAALAMGAENAVFTRDGGLPVGLTYMTGTLVKMGQELASIATSDNRWSWWPYAIHWLALVAGAVCGALTHGVMGLSALWVPACAALALAISVRGDFRDSQPGNT